AGGRNIERCLQPKPGEQKVDRDETGDGGPDRVERVERPHGPADVVFVLMEKGDEEGKRSTHKNGRHAEQAVDSEPDAEERTMQRGGADGSNEWKTDHAEGPNEHFAGTEQEEQVARKELAHHPADEGADAETEHENGDDQRDRLDVDAKCREQGAL